MKDITSEGAKHERSIINKFHQYLNSEDIIPNHYYNPASTGYRVTCSINNIISAFISKNYFVIPSLIVRTYNLLEDAPDNPNSRGYIALARRYLSHMGSFILNYTDFLSEYERDAIPRKILDGYNKNIDLDDFVKK